MVGHSSVSCRGQGRSCDSHVISECGHVMRTSWCGHGVCQFNGGVKVDHVIRECGHVMKVFCGLLWNMSILHIGYQVVM